MANLSRREKVLLLILGIIIIGFFYYKLLLIPELDGLGKSIGKYTSNNVTLNMLKTSEKNITNIKKQVEDLKTKTETAEKSIPDSSKIPEILMEFKNMTEQSGCQGARLSFGDPIDNSAGNANAQNNQNSKSPDTKDGVPAVIVLPIDCEVSGEYNNIMKLITEIENNNRKMVIDKLSFSKDPKSGKLTANININCFYMNTVGAAKPVDYSFIDTITGKQNMFD